MAWINKTKSSSSYSNKVKVGFTYTAGKVGVGVVGTAKVGAATGGSGGGTVWSNNIKY